MVATVVPVSAIANSAATAVSKSYPVGARANLTLRPDEPRAFIPQARARLFSRFRHLPRPCGPVKVND